MTLWPAIAAFRSSGSKAVPSLDQATESALGATALTGSSWSIVSRRTAVSRSGGRRLVSIWARTATRRASGRLS